MNKRILIVDLPEHVGETALLCGRIITVRRLGSVTFAVLQDRTAAVQTVWEKPAGLKVGDAVRLSGIVKKEPRAKGGFEISGLAVEVLATSIQDYPFDMSKPELNLNLNTLLDNRTISLRHPKIQAIFKLYATLLSSYGEAMRQLGFTEIKTPKLLGSPTEGGANFFKVQYFEKVATLAQSPQFYKQIMVGVFERAFEIGPVFRAEKHFTTRHVNEYISLDAEMGFIENFQEITSTLTQALQFIFERLAKEGKQYLELYGATAPTVPSSIPHVKLADLKKILRDKYGHSISDETDIDPEGEKLAGVYAKEEFSSEFIFVTHYPWKDRPFYTMPSKENPDETEGFDLIFRGVELVTGGQRIHDYEMLRQNMERKGVKPEGMEFYLDTFRYAMPPHGGWGLGSERLIQLLLGLGSVKEAVLFPRDVKRLSP